MQKKKTALLMAAAALAMTATPALADPSGGLPNGFHNGAPGTPGEPNCVGVTNSLFAQASKEEHGEPGIGNLAKIWGGSGMPTKDVQAFVRSYCGR